MILNFDNVLTSISYPFRYYAPKGLRMLRFMIIRLKWFECSYFSKFILSSWVLSAVREVGCSILNVRSRSMKPRIINMFAFQSLKFFILRMKIFFASTDIIVTDITTIQTVDPNKYASSHLKPNKLYLNNFWMNNKIPSTILISSHWTIILTSKWNS